jgi:hypothetical protein
MMLLPYKLQGHKGHIETIVKSLPASSKQAAPRLHQTPNLSSSKKPITPHMQGALQQQSPHIGVYQVTPMGLEPSLIDGNQGLALRWSDFGHLAWLQNHAVTCVIDPRRSRLIV